MARKAMRNGLTKFGGSTTTAPGLSQAECVLMS